jgi:hypothetical protein
MSILKNKKSMLSSPPSPRQGEVRQQAVEDKVEASEQNCNKNCPIDLNPKMAFRMCSRSGKRLREWTGRGSADTRLYILIARNITSALNDLLYKPILSLSI